MIWESSQSHVRVIEKSSQSHLSVVTESSQNHLTFFESSKNDLRIISESSKSYFKESSQSHLRVILESSQSSLSVIRESSQNHLLGFFWFWDFFFSLFLTWAIGRVRKNAQTTSDFCTDLIFLLIQVSQTPKWGLVFDTGQHWGHGYVGIEKGQHCTRCKRFKTKIDLLDTRRARKSHINFICYVRHLFESGSAIWSPFRGGVIFFSCENKETSLV